MEKKIFLVGFYGRGNLGDDWMCLSLLNELSIQKKNVLSVFCDDASFLKESPVPIDVVPRNIFLLLNNIRNSDYLVQGGGTIFHDSYKGAARLKYILVNLVWWWFIFTFAKLFSTKIILLGAGIGPIDNAIAKIICRRLLLLSSDIVVRDKRSYSELTELLGTNESIVLGCDLAQSSRMNFAEGKSDESVHPLIIGISVCELEPFLDEPKAEDGFWIAFADAVKSSFDGDVGEVKVRLLSLYNGSSSSSDKVTSEKIQSLVAPMECEHIVYRNKVSEFLFEINACDIVIATKFHALVAAYKLNKPLLAISYNRKLVDYCNEQKIDELYCVDINQKVSTLNFEKRFNKLISDERCSVRGARPLGDVELAMQDSIRSVFN